MLQEIGPAGQRQHQRYRVENTAFATLYRDQEIVLGIILNISRHGLAFKYIPQDNEHELEDRINSELKVDIFTQYAKIFIKNLSCKLIYKTRQPKESRMCQLQMNRCAVKFQDLDDEQYNKLFRILEINDHSYL